LLVLLDGVLVGSFLLAEVRPLTIFVPAFSSFLSIVLRLECWLFDPKKALVTSFTPLII